MDSIHGSTLQIRESRGDQPRVKQTVQLDDHSEVVPLLPIPNRTVKRLSADDSAGSRVKVGHRQATIDANQPQSIRIGAFLRLGMTRVVRFGARVNAARPAEL